MNRLAVGAVHDHALNKAKSLLIKAHSGRYVGDGEHSRNGAVLLLVEWINFLFSHGAPFSKTNILANTPGMVLLFFLSRAAYQNLTCSFVCYVGPMAAKSFRR